MFDRDDLRFVGPAGVIAAIACAQFAGYALAAQPASAFLWYLNLEVFRCFQYGPTGFGELLPLAPVHATALIALTLIMLLVTSLICGVRLPLAIACDFSFVYSLSLWGGSYLANATRTVTFDLSALSTPSSLLTIGLVLITSISSTVSHRRYWREIAPHNGSVRVVTAPAN